MLPPFLFLLESPMLVNENLLDVASFSVAAGPCVPEVLVEASALDASDLSAKACATLSSLPPVIALERFRGTVASTSRAAGIATYSS